MLLLHQLPPAAAAAAVTNATVIGNNVVAASAVKTRKNSKGIAYATLVDVTRHILLQILQLE